MISTEKYLYTCRYCKKTYNIVNEFHECQDFCRSKKYINKISTILNLDIKEIFEKEELTKEVIKMKYNRFMYTAYLKQQKSKKLAECDAIGLKQYYENILKPKLTEKKEGN